MRIMVIVPGERGSSPEEVSEQLGMRKKCPYCNNKTSEVDVLEEILEFAERSGTNIEFVDQNPLLEELGGVGALLRY